MQLNYSVVAFLDVLGFSAMVERDSAAVEPRYLPVFVEIFGEVGAEAREDVSLKMFSDSVVIEASLSPQNVVRVLEIVGDLQRRFLRRHILLRGGVAFGKHFMDRYVTFSQALVAAYGIESRIARFPRVVASGDLLNYTWHHSDATPELHEKLRGLLAVDRDGAIFVDYLNNDPLQVFREHVECCLSTGKSPHETVLEKMRWLLDYYNFQANRSGQVPIESSHFTNGFSALSSMP
ncbi:hypothetical protein ACEPUD_27335 [Burkholderia ubonensis]|uniref:hypothetical protein n=1 Tax=Burkholderia ubonensis TaxID=101571 RepID=UPI00358FEDA3